MDIFSLLNLTTQSVIRPISKFASFLSTDIGIFLCCFGTSISIIFLSFQWSATFYQQHTQFVQKAANLAKQTDLPQVQEADTVADRILQANRDFNGRTRDEVHLQDRYYQSLDALLTGLKHRTENIETTNQTLSMAHREVRVGHDIFFNKLDTQLETLISNRMGENSKFLQEFTAALMPCIADDTLLTISLVCEHLVRPTTAILQTLIQLIGEVKAVDITPIQDSINASLRKGGLPTIEIQAETADDLIREIVNKCLQTPRLRLTKPE